MPFKEIASPKVADAVVAQFEELLTHSVLRPGDALPAERTLAEELGVSRATLRDALEVLVQRGLIVRARGVGLSVADGLDAGLADPLANLISTRPEAVSDFLSFRRLLEAEAARLAAQQAAEPDLQRLATLIRHMEEAHANGDMRRGHRLDYELHLLIAEASGNLVTAHVSRALRRALSNTLHHTRKALFSRPNVPAAILAQHKALVDAILARDAEAAAAASNAHLDFVISEFNASRIADAQAARASLRPERL
ncbi:MAG: FCD domain-containing protein [Neomegalonema sp.]|nr:FCD domain-containing protein [Neomegalonema sp.]